MSWREAMEMTLADIDACFDRATQWFAARRAEADKIAAKRKR